MASVYVSQVQAIWGTDAEANLQKMEMHVNNIREEWGPSNRIVTFAEYATTGFVAGREEALAQSIPGPATRRLAALAKKTGYYICNGSMLERAKDGIYNTSLIFGPDGDIVHRYRKNFPVPGLEPLGIGGEFSVSDLPGIGKVGVMICYDGHFPEVARALAYHGAEIILWNSATFHPVKQQTRALVQARAFENSCYVVFTAGSGIFVGLGQTGNSMIADPHGIVLGECGETETIMAGFIDAGDVAKIRAEGVFGVGSTFLDFWKSDRSFPPYEPGAGAKWRASIQAGSKDRAVQEKRL